MLAFLLCFWALFQFSEGTVHQYSDGRFVSSGNGFLFYGGSEGMRASTTLGAAGGVSNGQSYIRFDSVRFRRTDDEVLASNHPEGNNSSMTEVIQALIFDGSDRDKVGSGTDAICCTPELVEQEGCKLGEVIVRPSNDNWPFLIPVSFKEDSVEAVLPSETVNINKPGLYNVYFIVCNPDLKGVVVNGMTVWKNPMGYLPGTLAPLVTFYGTLSLAYVLLGLMWFSQCLRCWNDMASLQSHLSVIIALGMLEVTLWYFEYTNYNATGRRPMVITFWAVTFGALKKTLCRLLILAVSLGYGVLRPTVGPHITKVVILTTIYFLAVEVLDLFQNMGTINELSGKEHIILVLPVAVLDAVFILWVFMSLSRILEKLQALRLVAKLDMYRRLTNTLSMSVVVSVAWIGYEFYFKVTNTNSERWQGAWVVGAFWSVLTFTLLCAVCVIWAPSKNPLRYAFVNEADDSFLDEEDPIMSITNVIDDKKERKPTPTHLKVFGLEGVPEENKRE